MGLCLRRLVLQYPWRGGRVQPESVAAFNRNQWQPSPGIGGRFRPESVATFARNTQADCLKAIDVSSHPPGGRAYLNPRITLTGRERLSRLTRSAVTEHGTTLQSTIPILFLTLIGKPPPLAVRLAEALPFRRAPGSEERRPLNVRPPAYGRGLPAPYPCRAGLWRGDMARVTPCASANGSRGFVGPEGPFPALLAPSGGLHQTTRSAGST